jgi:hypothetical protein
MLKHCSNNLQRGVTPHAQQLRSCLTTLCRVWCASSTRVAVDCEKTPILTPPDASRTQVPKQAKARLNKMYAANCVEVVLGTIEAVQGCCSSCILLLGHLQMQVHCATTQHTNTVRHNAPCKLLVSVWCSCIYHHTPCNTTYKAAPADSATLLQSLQI